LVNIILALLRYFVQAGTGLDV